LICCLSTLSIQAQIDFEFFELNANRVAKALIQRQIDTILINNDLILSLYELEKIETWDTSVIKNNYYFLTENTNINLLLPFGEIREEYLVVKKKSSILVPINCDIDCYEKKFYKKEILEESYLWKNEEDILNPKKWYLDSFPNQIISIPKYILKTPILQKQVEIPIHYITKRIFVPNKALNQKELEIINSECIKQTVFTYKATGFNKKLKEEKRYSNRYNEYKVIQNGRIEKVEKLNKEELEKVFTQLSIALYKKGYIVILHEINYNEVKRGLIRFQIDNNLPIGQFDLETIKMLLEKGKD